MKSVSRHKEVSAGGGSFAQQGGLIARQSLSICVSRTTCCAISNNLSLRWFYQDHRWFLINKYVVLIKLICGPTSKLCYLVYMTFYTDFCVNIRFKTTVDYQCHNTGQCLWCSWVAGFDYLNMYYICNVKVWNKDKLKL